MDTLSTAIPRLRFGIGRFGAVATAAVPTLRMLVTVACENGDEVDVAGVALNVDVRIAAHRRRYAQAEALRLREVLGHPGMHASDAPPIEWTRSSLYVPAFDRTTDVLVHLPCSYDFDLVATKYATALDDGSIPLDVQLSGTIFYRCDERFTSVRLAPDNVIAASVPLATWRAALAAVFFDEAWLRVDRELLQRLQTYRSAQGHASWDESLSALLAAATGKP